MTLRIFYLFITFAAIFMLSGMALNMVVRTISPAPYMGLLTEKIETFKKHRDEIDILFIGTSRTFRQMNVQAMENHLQNKNCGRATLFNLGVPNLTYPELLYVLEHVYEEKPKALKMVVLGETMPAVRPQLGRLKIDRIRYFSGIQGTSERFTDIISYQEPVFKKAGRLAISLVGFAYEQANIGHLSRTLFPALYLHNAIQNSETKNMPKDWWPSRGYLSLQEQGHVNDIVQKRHEDFLENIEAFEKTLMTQKQSNPDKTPSLSATRQALYNNLFQRIKDQGQEVGFYLPPLPGRMRENKTLAAALQNAYPDLHLLHYNDPARASEYWNAGLWFDKDHLNDAGSKALSLNIANKLCPIVKEWETR